MKLFEELLEIIQNLIIKFMILTEKVKGNESLLCPSSSCRINQFQTDFFDKILKKQIFMKGEKEEGRMCQIF